MRLELRRCYCKQGSGSESERAGRESNLESTSWGWWMAVAGCGAESLDSTLLDNVFSELLAHYGSLFSRLRTLCD